MYFENVIVDLNFLFPFTIPKNLFDINENLNKSKNFKYIEIRYQISSGKLQ